MPRSLHRWIAVSLALAGAVGIDGVVDAHSTAVITGSFSDACRAFVAHSSKDISYVMVRYADGRVVKDETIGRPEFSLDGASGDEIASADVKSGQTVSTFHCQPSTTPPVALVESRRCGFGACGDWTAQDSPGTHETCSHYQDTIPLRGTNSDDVDNDIVSWSLDFGDGAAPASGAWATAPPADVGHVFQSFGLITVTLTLTDSAGHVGVDTIVVCITDFTPD